MVRKKGVPRYSQGLVNAVETEEVPGGRSFLGGKKKGAGGTYNTHPKKFGYSIDDRKRTRWVTKKKIVIRKLVPPEAGCANMKKSPTIRKKGKGVLQV